MSDQTIKIMADAFLRWPLPKTVCADSCSSLSTWPAPRYGTNLLTAVEAEQMMREVVIPHLPNIIHALEVANTGLEVEIEKLRADNAVLLADKKTILADNKRLRTKYRNCFVALTRISFEKSAAGDTATAALTECNEIDEQPDTALDTAKGETK